MAFLTFIKNFTINAINKKKSLSENDECHYGITLLWEYLKDEGKKVNFLIESSYNFLYEILKLNSVDKSIIQKYIKLGLENLKNGQSVVQSIILLKNLYNLYEKQSLQISKISKKDNFLKKSSENYDLINLIISDFKRYINKVKKQAKIDNNSSDILSIVSLK